MHLREKVKFSGLSYVFNEVVVCRSNSSVSSRYWQFCVVKVVKVLIYIYDFATS
jgi:hypothetical protein